MNTIYAETKNYHAQGIGYSGAKAVIAYILLMNNNYIASFIIDRNKKDAE